jgi:formamidopyrimidine-DNA glycosylase
MPELPEVETLRRSLLPLAGLRISHATLRRPDILLADPGTPPAQSLLQGDRLAALERRGKQLALIGASSRTLVVQLGMSGQLLLSNDSPPPTHTHALWTFESGATLLFRDPRRFGCLTALASRQALDSRWQTLGPDALTIDGTRLRTAAANSQRAIKAALLDQSVLAGVGNIYADEALFLAAIRPTTRCHRLPLRAWSRLAQAIRHVLAQAVQARGSTLRDYRDASGTPGAAQLAHRVYGRAGKPCPTCATPIQSRTVSQRTTCFCPRCQPAS